MYSQFRVKLQSTRVSKNSRVVGTGDLTVTQVTDFVIVVIFETVMSTGHKTQKESYACQEDLRIFIIIIISLKMSVAEVLLVCCICTRNL